MNAKKQVAAAALLAAMGWAPSAPAPVPVASAPMDDGVIDPPPAAAKAPVRTPVLASPRPSLVITHDGGWWRIEAFGASRLDAAHQLARLNGVPLRGATTRLAQTRPLELHWQDRDPAAAWQALLGTEVSYALQCGVGRCQVWIVGAGEGAPVATGPATAIAMPVDDRPIRPDNAGEAPPYRDRIDPPEPLHPD